MRKKERPSRRQWLRGVAGLIGGAALGASRRSREAMGGEEGFTLPVYRVAADSYGELGFQIGAAAKKRIQAAYETRKKWVEDLEAFARQDHRHRWVPFLTALEDELPHLLEELKGLAEGSGVPFEKLFAVCLNPELSTLQKGVSYHEDCTSAAVCAGGRIWLAHNEDGSCAYRGSMYLLELTFPDGTRSLCLSYPGYWPGNGPSINSHGLAQTVNYIGASSLQPGIPRYALDRAIMQAKTLEEAVALACHPRRAYSQHHLLFSAREKKMISVETSPTKSSVLSVDGIFVHANHFIHPGMKDEPQLALYKGSSLPRQKTAEEWASQHRPANSLSFEELHELLASHRHYPLSICRHPAPPAIGCTLAAVMIAAESQTIRFYENEPCRGISRDFPWPAA